MRNLNDVIKEGNTGENVTHSWDFYSCIIISWKHFGYNTSSITGRGGRYVSRARPPAPHSAINGATSRATRRSAPVAARRRAAGAGAAQSGGSAAAGLQRALRSTTTLLTSGPRAALLWNFKKKNCKIAGSNGVKRAPSCSRVRRGHRSPRWPTGLPALSSSFPHSLLQFTAVPAVGSLRTKGLPKPKLHAACTLHSDMCVCLPMQFLLERPPHLCVSELLTWVLPVGSVRPENTRGSHL